MLVLALLVALAPQAGATAPPGLVPSQTLAEGLLAVQGIAVWALHAAVQSIVGNPQLTAAGSLVGDPTSNAFVEWMHAVVFTRTPGHGRLARLLPPVAVVAGHQGGPPDEPTFESDTRKAVYQAIDESPGRYVAELESATGIPESTVRYHVRLLEDRGLVRSATIRGKRRYYLPMAEEDIHLEAALEDDSTGAILAAVAELEPASVTDIATAVGVAPSTVSYHLQRLAHCDLVDRERRGQSVVTCLEPAVRSSFAEGVESTEGDAGHGDG